MTALIMVATYAIKIPTPATNGYANLGDAFVMFAGVVFGPIVGFLVGGAGSALADLAGGYAHWILPTFVIKGAEGAISGILFLLLKRTKLNKFISVGISTFVAGVIMILGYFLASTIMKGSVAAAFASFPANCVQGSVGVVIIMLILVATYKIKGFDKLLGHNNFYYPKVEPKTVETVPENSDVATETDDKNKDMDNNQGGEE